VSRFWLTAFFSKKKPPLLCQQLCTWTNLFTRTTDGSVRRQVCKVCEFAKKNAPFANLVYAVSQYPGWASDQEHGNFAKMWCRRGAGRALGMRLVCSSSITAGGTRHELGIMLLLSFASVARKMKRHHLPLWCWSPSSACCSRPSPTRAKPSITHSTATTRRCAGTCSGLCTRWKRRRTTLCKRPGCPGRLRFQPT